MVVVRVMPEDGVGRGSEGSAVPLHLYMSKYRTPALTHCNDSALYMTCSEGVTMGVPWCVTY